MSYNIVINPQVIADIQLAIDYYEEQQDGLGIKFEEYLNKQILKLQKQPHYQVRYDEVRCLPLKKFPFMIHFTINETARIVMIRAIFHTSIDPISWNR
jgi:toxin ParE1/3/4